MDPNAKLPQLKFQNHQPVLPSIKSYLYLTWQTGETGKCMNERIKEHDIDDFRPEPFPTDAIKSETRLVYHSVFGKINPDSSGTMFGLGRAAEIVPTLV